MKIYVVMCANEDGYISVVGSRKMLEKAQDLMKSNWGNTCQGLHEEGFVPTMKMDEFSALLNWGEGHLLRYLIDEITV